MQLIPAYVPVRSRDDQWREKFPRGIAALIGVIQLFLTLGILVCETISMLNGFEHGFLFIGYGTSFFFTITWITVLSSLCCIDHCCATYTLIMEILCLCFSIVLLVFDILFLQNPYKCFFTSTIYGCSLSWSYYYDSSWSFDSSYLSIADYKVPAIKGQLAGTVIMLVTAILYIIIYIQTTIKIRRWNQSSIQPVYRVPHLQQPPQTLYRGPGYASPVPPSYPSNAKC